MAEATPEETRAAPAPRPPEPPPRPRRIETPDGLVIETLAAGEPPVAAVGDRVAIHFTARLAETGEEVESTRTSGIPYRFTLGEREVVRGLERALVGARQGDRLRVHVPAALAYGERGWGDVPPGSDLAFEIHLVHVARD